MAKILIVDDEQVYCRNLKILLERQGHQIEIAGDGIKAMAIAESFVPELLLVDWMLRSEMDGLELAILLHALIPNLSSILMTGFPAEELDQQIIQAPIATVLRKPFATEDLIKQIELVLHA